MVKQTLRWRLLELLTLGLILLSCVFNPANHLAAKFLVGQTEAYAADWASPRFDVAQTGYNRDGIALMPLNLSWQRGAFYIYDEDRTRPLIVGDKVLLGVNDWYNGVTTIYALSVYGGSTIWQYNPSDKSISGLVSANGKVYFSAQNPTTSAAKLYALDLATGSLVWTADIGTTRPGRPVVDGQDLYIVNSGGLYVIDAVNGAIKRTISLPGSYSTTSRPAVSQGLVFVNYGNGVCAVDPQSGQIKWTYSVLYGPISAPAVGNNTVYVAGDYKLTAIDAATGSIKWQTAVSGRHAGIDADRWEPTLTDNMVFIGAIEAYDANTGSLKWGYETLYRNKFYTNEENATSAAVLGGYVFVGINRTTSTFFDTSDGRLYVFKASTGELAYLFERGSYYNSWPADSSPAVGNNRVAINFATNNLTLFTFNSIKGISGFKGADYISALEPLDCHEDSFIADPVNASTGGQEINRTLLTLNGAQPLLFKVRYNTLLLAEGPFGKGWEHNFGTSLEETQSGNVIIHWSANRKNTFVSNGNGQYSGQDLAIIHDTLVKNQDGSYTLTRKNQSKYLFNTEGKLTQQKNSHGQPLNMSYDASGHLIKVEESISGRAVNIGYNAAGLINQVTDNANRKVTFGYDTNQNLTSITDAKGQTTSNTYDSEGRIVAQDDAVAGNQLARFSYDEITDPGKLITTVTDRNGKTRVLTHDYKYQLISVEDELQNITATYTYDTQYDDAGRLATLISPEDTTTYAYDANGNILTVTDSTGTITREYDALNRLTKHIDAQGNTILYSYDAVGNLATLTYPGGKRVTYGYDVANRLVSVTDWMGRVTTYDYDANGRLIKTTRPNGTVLTRIYNEAGQLTLQEDTDRNGNIISQYNYGYDAAGNVTLEQNASEEDTFTLSNTSMTYGSDNRLATFNGQPVFYDEDGNMTTGSLSGSMANYTYDSRSSLTSAGNLSYLYDAENNRIGMVDNGKTTRYVINPNARLSQVLIKTDDQGNKTFYVYGLGLIGQEEANGTYKTYHFDRRGSTVAITDENGNVTDHFQYAPYGELVRHDGPTATPFMFNGRYGVMTDSNGLYYMRARYYNPEIRRFINQDVLTGSIDNGQSLNKYAYANGNPISYIDPFGLWGIGLSGSESTEIGVVFDDGKIGLGASQTGSYGGGFFSHGFFENPSIGSFGSWGGYTGGPGYGVDYPSGADKDNKGGGAYVGIGLNAFMTNAGSATDLNGPAKTFSINIGWADRVFALQVARGDNGIWMISYGGIPLPGAGLGFSVSDYYTYTEARK